MKLILLTVPDNTTENQAIEIATAAMHIVLTNVHVNVLSQQDLMPSTLSTVEDTGFIKAIERIITICGDTAEPEAFRGALWDAILLKRVIDRPILERLAQGPLNIKEKRYLKQNNCEFVPIVAASALTRLAELQSWVEH